jgi:uncharacterized protein (TIGR00375 family)
MMVADFHIHSKYSRATSQEMNVEGLSRWARLKGIDLLGTGDFTYANWRSELEDKLRPCGDGLYEHDGTLFILSSEVCNIFERAGKTRRIHNLLFAPDFKSVDEINRALAQYGKLESDGRPILSLDAARLVKIVHGINSNCFVVPAHVWTPWFSLFGAESGVDSVEMCFEEETRYIYALETGLSSDPAMNYRWSALDKYTLISNSDSHSPRRIGRECNVFASRFKYAEILETLKKKDPSRLLMTVEFFPQEGKYHYDGHRKCETRMSPKESKKNSNICPVCGRRVTVGVMHRVESLCDREEGFRPAGSIPFINTVQLDEIVAESLGKGVDSPAVEAEYMRILQGVGTEHNILVQMNEEELKEKLPTKIARGVLNVRKGRVDVVPGYDGEYGKVRVLGSHDTCEQKQMTLF